MIRHADAPVAGAQPVSRFPAVDFRPGAAFGPSFPPSLRSFPQPEAWRTGTQPVWGSARA